MVEKGNKYTK